MMGKSLRSDSILDRRIVKVTSTKPNQCVIWHDWSPCQRPREITMSNVTRRHLLVAGAAGVGAALVPAGVERRQRRRLVPSPDAGRQRPGTAIRRAGGHRLAARSADRPGGAVGGGGQMPDGSGEVVGDRGAGQPASLALNRPEGRCASGPAIRSALICSMIAWPRCWASACTRVNGLSVKTA
jgi:hypothetical protein